MLTSLTHKDELKFKNEAVRDSCALSFQDDQFIEFVIEKVENYRPHRKNDLQVRLTLTSGPDNQRRNR